MNKSEVILLIMLIISIAMVLWVTLTKTPPNARWLFELMRRNLR